MAKKKKWLVFVSHSGEDTWVARQISREISDRGATPFLDEADIDVGAEFEEDIRDFLDKADELLVLFTPWALDRPYVWIEIGAVFQILVQVVQTDNVSLLEKYRCIGMSLKFFRGQPCSTTTIGIL